MNFLELSTSRAWRRIGWAYVAYWILVSGFYTYALVDEAITFGDTRRAGEDLLIYGFIATIFPMLVPGMAVTAGLHGGPFLERPPAFWVLTIPTLMWAIIGWWTLASTVWRCIEHLRGTQPG